MAREITGEEDEDAREEMPPVRRRRRPWTLLGFFNTAVYLLAALAAVFVYLPGADPPRPGGGTSDILGLIENADAEARESVVLTEDTFNALLEGTLVARDTGPVAMVVSHGRAWVHLHEGRAEIFLEKIILGHVSTVSLEVELEQTGVARTLTVTGGRFGRLPVPVGALRLVLPAFASLKDAYTKEITAILSAKKITVEPGKMLLSL